MFYVTIAWPVRVLLDCLGMWGQGEGWAAEGEDRGRGCWHVVVDTEKVIELWVGGVGVACIHKTGHRSGKTPFLNTVKKSPHHGTTSPV